MREDQDMYEGSVTAVRSVVGVTDAFEVEAGLHPGSTRSPFRFAVVMDTLTDEIRQQCLWAIIFADNTVICGDSREQGEETLE